MSAPYNVRLFVYITAEHRKLLTRWTQAALGEDRHITQSEIIRFALDQANKLGYKKASPLLRERRGRPPIPRRRRPPAK
jgi:hypothetical protein